jgi:DNA mismatch repair protein MutS2
MTDPLLDKTLSDLEWSRIEAAVANLLRGPRAADFRLPLGDSREATERALEETAEALETLSAGEPLPLDGIRDIALHLLRVERHGDLDVTQLNDIRYTLGSARRLRKFLNARRAALPQLNAACPIDPTLDALSESLDDAFDAEGTLADHASVELKRLRTETRNLRASLVGKLEELVHRHAELLSDKFYTLREGRYVLPVRADTHERVHGIVHGASASGATIFVEPRALIVQGNRLKLAEAEEEREVARILAALSDEVRQRHASLAAAYAALLHADLRSASARLCKELALTRPVLAEQPLVRLTEAKHPVLMLDGVDVVANDVAARSGQALVISGPNAGGKTVALKLLGLSALMVRAGLFLPAAENSQCGFFPVVLSDIGDEQSLSKNLSTFSAHVQHMRQILEVAGEGSLVLLDELAGSTDPEEGAALACSVVERLCELGAAVAVTTHYEPLKARALSDDRLRNASVGFDVARMAPTFRLRLDVPGASSALVVAERFGLPHQVVERARQILPEQSKHFDALVKQLEHKLGEVDRREAELASDLARTSEARRAAEAELDKQRSREKKALGEAAQKLFEELREARSELERAKKSLRHKRLDQDELKELGKRVEQGAAAAQRPEVQALAHPAAAQPDVREVAPEAIAVGRRVYVPRLRAEVEIVEPPSKGKVRVAAGAMRLWVDVAELRTKAGGDGERADKGDKPAAGLRRPAVRSHDNSIDLRGMRVDDALDMLESFLDRMYGRDESVAFIEHGFGSGALRDAVREFLGRPSPYVANARPGTVEEGGDKLTVVTLR